MKTSPPREKGTAPMRQRPRVTWNGELECLGKVDVVVTAYSGVEQSTRDSEKDPGVYGEGEAEAKTDV